MFYFTPSGNAVRTGNKELIAKSHEMIAKLEQWYKQTASEPDMLELAANVANFVEAEYGRIKEFQASYTETLFLDFMLWLKKEHYAATVFMAEARMNAAWTSYECSKSRLMIATIIENIPDPE